MIKYTVTIGPPADAKPGEHNARIEIHSEGDATDDMQRIAAALVAKHLRLAVAEIKQAFDGIAERSGGGLTAYVLAADPLTATALATPLKPVPGRN